MEHRKLPFSKKTTLKWSLSLFIDTLRGGLQMKPLEGIRILDLTRVLAGPYTAMMLTDYGADVIKIEAPETGDDSRVFGPFVGTESAYFMSLNRGKRSMTLNLKSPEAQDLFKEMVTKADVILENYRPGTMEKFGLGYDILQAVNPRIIYAACSGFGHSGPYMEKPAYDVIVQGLGGLMSILVKNTANRRGWGVNWRYCRGAVYYERHFNGLIHAHHIR
jgi:crotonobetainyl-CoA:carnitine CoA-transferase CaiB-like acyl-CoA transferase